MSLTLRSFDGCNGKSQTMQFYASISVNVPARRTRWRNAFAVARGDETAMRPFAKLFCALV